MQKKEVLLFDMDGVLLTPGGYHRALQDSVAFLGGRLGFSSPRLAHDVIHSFEAAGITNEWDTLAICAAFMLDIVSGSEPSLRRRRDFLQKPYQANGLAAPEFAVLPGRLGNETSASDGPIERAKALFGQDLHWILEEAYRIDGVTQRVQQEHVLGSAAFEQVYGLAPLLGVPSYLSVYDRSNLDADQRARLRRWLQKVNHGAAIFTNRPSLSPDERLGTPEAEMGAALVGLEGTALAGSGGIVWLEERATRRAGSLNKPHPVHALAALRMALGERADAAFSEALRLYEHRRPDSAWQGLHGGRAWVFEDAVGGIESLRVAIQLLAGHGIALTGAYMGVSENPAKQRALQKAGASVYPEFAAALNAFFESQGL